MLKNRQQRSHTVQTLNVPDWYASVLHSLRPCWTTFLSILWEYSTVVAHMHPDHRSSVEPKMVYGSLLDESGRPEDAVYRSPGTLGANAIPGRGPLETGSFWGAIAACPRPVLGLPYSLVRLQSSPKGLLIFARNSFWGASEGSRFDKSSVCIGGGRLLCHIDDVWVDK